MRLAALLFSPVALLAQSPPAPTDVPRAEYQVVTPKETALVISEASLTPEGSEKAPVLRGLVDNRGAEYWQTVHLKVKADVQCADRELKTISFIASLGDLSPGPGNRFADSIPAIADEFDGCKLLNLTAGFSSGVTITASEYVKREKLRAEVKRDIELRAAAKAKASADRAEKDRIESEQRAKVRALCAMVFRDTADRKVSELTVRQTDQISECRAFGAYHD